MALRNSQWTLHTNLRRLVRYIVYTLLFLVYADLQQVFASMTWDTVCPKKHVVHGQFYGDYSHCGACKELNPDPPTAGSSFTREASRAPTTAPAPTAASTAQALAAVARASGHNAFASIPNVANAERNRGSAILRAEKAAIPTARNLYRLPVHVPKQASKDKEPKDVPYIIDVVLYKQWLTTTHKRNAEYVSYSDYEEWGSFSDNFFESDWYRYVEQTCEPDDTGDILDYLLRRSGEPGFYDIESAHDGYMNHFLITGWTAEGHPRPLGSSARASTSLAVKLMSYRTKPSHFTVKFVLHLEGTREPATPVKPKPKPKRASRSPRKVQGHTPAPTPTPSLGLSLRLSQARGDSQGSSQADQDALQSIEGPLVKSEPVTAPPGPTWTQAVIASDQPPEFIDLSHADDLRLHSPAKRPTPQADSQSNSQSTASSKSKRRKVITPPPPSSRELRPKVAIQRLK